MIKIRKLCFEDMKQAIEIKLLCWPEELNHYSESQLNFEEEFIFWTKWMEASEENNDVRLLYGAFDDNSMLGVAFGSFVESKDMPESGFELNGLWVSPGYRGQGISLKLLSTLLREFYKLGSRHIVIYNFHYAPSNSFYRKLGCQVIDTEYQLKEQVPVDIFTGNIIEVQNKINASLIGYSKMEEI
jgi:GNAT superfamily N-acetyltransferase